MNETTDLLKRIYHEEIADIRRVKHYKNPYLDLDEILKKSVLLGSISDHYHRFETVMRLFDAAAFQSGEDYFYASFVLAQEDYIENYALGCMLAMVSRKMNFFGNNEVPDMDEYIKKLNDNFYRKVTGLD